jgi:enamine deaminase RidA (YjgF/YER057c/UK114 family)
MTMMHDAPSRRRFFGGATAATLGMLLPARVAGLTGIQGKRAGGAGTGLPQVSPEGRLRELGIELPTPRAPVATYVPAVTVGSTLYVAGHTPRMPDGSAGIVGRVGADLTLDEGRDAARMVGLLVLATIRAHLGSLDRVARLVRTFGMVNATPDFGQQPQVINGFSDLMVDVFGEEAGKGTRAAVGMGSLPGGMAVEVETIWEVRS